MYRTITYSNFSLSEAHYLAPPDLNGSHLIRQGWAHRSRLTRGYTSAQFPNHCCFSVDLNTGESYIEYPLICIAWSFSPCSSLLWFTRTAISRKICCWNGSWKIPLDYKKDHGHPLLIVIKSIFRSPPDPTYAPRKDLPLLGLLWFSLLFCILRYLVLYIE